MRVQRRGTTLWLNQGCVYLRNLFQVEVMITSAGQPVGVMQSLLNQLSNQRIDANRGVAKGGGTK